MADPGAATRGLARSRARTASGSRQDRQPPGILMLISHFSPAVGGTENQAFYLAGGLAGAGHRVTVLTLARPGAPARETLDGVMIERALRGLGHGVVFAVTYGASLLRHLRRLRASHAILHAHHLYLEAMAAALVGLRAGLPTVAKVACGGLYGDFARLHRTGLAGGQPLLRRLSRVVAISEEINGELLAHGFAPNRIAHIPNGVDVRRFAPAQDPDLARRQVGLGSETVLFLGRLDSQKGLETALTAWARVAAKRPSAQLVFAGDGPARNALETQARGAGFGEQVRFLGTRSDPGRLLQASQLFLLPSKSEGISNALLEAMATGVACVASRVGGNCEVLEHGVSGLLVPPGDAAALADAVVTLLEDEALRKRLGTAARIATIERYGVDRMVRRYVHLYTELAGEPV